MIDFQFILFKLKLYTSEGVLAEGVPVIIQYYSFLNESWVNLYEETLTKGSLELTKSATTGVVIEEDFFNLIAYGKMPPVRILPATSIRGITKQLVIANTMSFSLDADLDTFILDFGTLWLTPQELITETSNSFPDFLPIANFYQVTLPVAEPDNGPIPINELYTNIVSEIESANEASKASGFKLSNISLKLKALVQHADDTVNVSLLDLENSENVNGDAISEFVFDITPVQASEIAQGTMPDVTGLTETAVRRILRSLGLRLNPVYQNVSSVVNGDSFKQSPAEGTSVQPNQLITVIFSKHE